jgi:hypothetical protein
MTLVSMKVKGTEKVVARLNLSPLESEILGYLEGNQPAEDTLQGIVEWWLLNQHVRLAITAAKKALVQLVIRGKVVEVQGPDGRIHYRAKHRKSGTRDIPEPPEPHRKNHHDQ